MGHQPPVKLDDDLARPVVVNFFKLANVACMKGKPVSRLSRRFKNFQIQQKKDAKALKTCKIAASIRWNLQYIGNLKGRSCRVGLNRNRCLVINPNFVFFVLLLLVLFPLSAAYDTVVSNHNDDLPSPQNEAIQQQR